jgi:CDP-diacylglycerol--serine O-phosphatidyltransferase
VKKDVFLQTDFKMKKHIPNLITCCNLISGCFAILFATRGLLEVASMMILLAAVFDFFDGFAARMLHVQSPMGVDMDSLSDVVSFGVAPTTIVFVFLTQLLGTLPPSIREGWVRFLPFVVFVVPAFSAVRLARFNHDERQHEEFRGLATPANALFIGFLHFSAKSIPLFNNFWLMFIMVLVFAVLLLTDIPMFSLKFKNLHFKENWVRYLFLAIAVVLFAIFRFGALPIIILVYILTSLIIIPFKHHIHV